MEVPCGVKGIDEISTTEALFLMDAQPDRRSRLEFSVFLQAKQLKVDTILRNTHGLSPRAFAEAFGDGFGGFMELLPREYDLVISLKCFTPEVINVAGWIASNEVLAGIRRAGEIYQSSFRGFYETKIQQLENFWQLPQSVGFINFELGRRDINNISFSELRSVFTRINSQADMESRSQDGMGEIYPIPLRRSEGCSLGISDALKLSEESTLVIIAKQRERIGLCLATPPTTEGEKMLKRLGYVSIRGLELPGEAASYPKIMGAERAKYGGHWAKVAYLPAQVLL